MSMNIHVAEAKVFLKGMSFTEEEMLIMEKPIALMIVNTQRTMVPVDTGATKASIRPHIQESSATRIVDDVGPETDYSTYIEFGVVSKPNYPIQPFVRPSVFGANARKVTKVAEASFAKMVKKKHG